MSIDSSTDVGGAKQLFSASSNFVLSSIWLKLIVIF
jgi:hypothetical protein